MIDLFCKLIYYSSYDKFDRIHKNLRCKKGLCLYAKIGGTNRNDTAGALQ